MARAFSTMLQDASVLCRGKSRILFLIGIVIDNGLAPNKINKNLNYLLPSFPSSYITSCIYLYLNFKEKIKREKKKFKRETYTN